MVEYSHVIAGISVAFLLDALANTNVKLAGDSQNRAKSFKVLAWSWMGPGLHNFTFHEWIKDDVETRMKACHSTGS